MKQSVTIIISLLIYATTFGQVISDDLPKPVARFLDNHYKKQEVTLKNIGNDKPGVQDRFYAIYAENAENPKGYLHLGTVKTCRAGGCSGPADLTPTDSGSEYFDYLIIFNPGMAIETIQVFNYQASYGHEIAARGWLKQFQGFKGEKALEPGKDIDIISGATISVNAITDDVQWKTRLLQQILH